MLKPVNRKVLRGPDHLAAGTWKGLPPEHQSRDVVTLWAGPLDLAEWFHSYPSDPEDAAEPSLAEPPERFRFENEEWAFFACTSGSGAFLTPSAEYPVYPRRLLLLPPGLRGEWRITTPLYFHTAAFRSVLIDVDDLPGELWAIDGKEPDLALLQNVAQLVQAPPALALGHELDAILHLLIVRALREIAQDRSVATASTGQRFIEYLESQFTDPSITVASMASHLNCSERYLYGEIKRLTGLGPQQLLTNLRIARAKQLLAGSDLNATQIARDVGFTDLDRFSRTFRRTAGMPPTLFRQRPTLTRRRRRVKTGQPPSLTVLFADTAPPTWKSPLLHTILTHIGTAPEYPKAWGGVYNVAGGLSKAAEAGLMIGACEGIIFPRQATQDWALQLRRRFNDLASVGFLYTEDTAIPPGFPDYSVVFRIGAFIQQALRTAADLGRQRVALIGTDMPGPMRATWVEGCATHQLRSRKRWVLSLDGLSTPHALSLLQLLLDPESESPDVLVLSDDVLLESVSRVLQDLNMRIPEDVTLISLANFPEADFVTSAVPVHLIGFRLADIYQGCCDLVRLQQGLKEGPSVIALPLYEKFHTHPDAPITADGAQPLEE